VNRIDRLNKTIDKTLVLISNILLFILQRYKN